MITRNGIYNDLEESRYKLEVPDTGIIFVFSSELYMNKFSEQHFQHRKQFNKKLLARYKVKVDSRVYADVVLYYSIEKRGFLIKNKRGYKVTLDKLTIGDEVIRGLTV